MHNNVNKSLTTILNSATSQHIKSLKSHSLNNANCLWNATWHALISSNSLICECLKLDLNLSSLSSQKWHKLSTKQLVMKVNIHFQTNDASLSPLASWLLSLCTHLTTLSTSFIFPGQAAPRQPGKLFSPRRWESLREPSCWSSWRLSDSECYFTLLMMVSNQLPM